MLIIKYKKTTYLELNLETPEREPVVQFRKLK